MEIANDDLRAERNQLLRGLPRADLIRLEDHGERLWLSAGTVLGDTGRPLVHACFPIGATIAVMAHVDLAASLQVGLIGDDGIFASTTIGGVATAPLAAQICTGGWIWRLDSGRFQQWLADSGELRERFGRYLLSLLGQAAQISVCTRYDRVEGRLARWLLLMAARTRTRSFRLRHLAMAEMLGTHRSVISLAAMRLRSEGLIDYRRGVVTVLDSEALEAVVRGGVGSRRSEGACPLPSHDCGAA